MPNKLYLIQDTPIICADSGYSGSLGTQTVDMDLRAVGSNSARQSAKFDLAVTGAKLADEYLVFGEFEFDNAAPPQSRYRTPRVFVGFSPSATPGTANPAGLSGSAGAYSGTGGDSLSDSLSQLHFAGAMLLTNDVSTTVQYGYIGRFKPAQRYAILVAATVFATQSGGTCGIGVFPVSREVQ